MSNTIKLKRGSGSDPSASDLAVGEVALRTDTAKLFTKKDDNSVAEIGGGLSDGDKGDITVSNSGATFTIDNDAVTTAKINANAVGLSELFQHNNDGFIATTNGGDCVVNTYPSYTESGDVFLVHDIKLNRDSNNNDPVIGAGASPATVTFRTNQNGASGAGVASILNQSGLQLGRMNEYVKLAAPTDQTGQSSYTFTFPITGGSANELLLTNGSGTTSFSLLSNASVASDAAIAGTKIDPDFGSQNITTTGNVDLSDNSQIKLGTGNDLLIHHNATDNIFECSNGEIIFKDTSGSIDFKIQGHEGNAANLFLYADEGDDPQDRWKFTAYTDGVLGLLYYKGSTSNFANSAKFTNDAGVELYYTGVKVFETTDGGASVTGNLDVSSGVDVTGSITVTGTVDGVDVAALNTTLSNITTGTSSNNGKFLRANNGQDPSYETIDIVQDTSPQLGGDLDVQSSKITTATSNGNVKIEPNGTGVVEIRGAGGNDGALQLNCSAQSHGIKLVSPAHSASQSYTLIFPDNQIAADKYLKVKSISGSGSTATGQLEFEALDANDLGEGTIPDARFPSTLPALNGSALTNLNASNIASGTISSSRVPTLNQNTTGSSASCTGNAATATALANARTISGASFDGTANITLNNSNITNGAGYLTSVGTANISDNAVVLSKIEDFDSGRIMGRLASGSGDCSQLTASSVRSIINVEDGATADQSNAEIAAALSDQRPSMKGATFTDDGTDSPIVNIKTDDNSPWGLRLGNDSYSTNVGHGLMAYQNNDGNVYFNLYGNSAYENLYFQQGNGSTTRTLVHLDTSGAVNLNYAGSTKGYTTSSGFAVNGTCTATTFSGSGASLTSIPAGNLTGTLPAISGANLTNLPGGGKILQVLRGSLDGSFGTSSGSYQATGCSVSITMTDSSNKVLVLAGGTVNNTSADEGGKTTIYRGSTNIATHGTNIAGYWQEANSNNVEQSQFLSALDTPGAGTHTYEVRIYAHNGTMYWGYRNTGVIYVLEVDA